VPRLRGRGDDLGVIAIGEHGAPTARPWFALADRRVEVLGGRDLEPLHARRQRALVVGLHEQVHMGALDADMHDAEVLAPGGRQRGFADRLVGEPAAQAADGADRPQDHVHRMPCLELGPLLVRRARPPALWLATGAAPFAAALLEQHQLRRLRAPRTAATSCWLANLHATWILIEHDSVNRFRRYFGRRWNASIHDQSWGEPSMGDL
jgi:hypothetical protein